MGSSCPRCGDVLRPLERRVPQLPVAHVEYCNQCHGMWFDAAEIARAHPLLAELPERPELTEHAHPRDYLPLGPCPRCGEQPVEFAFFDVTLDYCRGCHGVWVDGNELADLTATYARRDGFHGAPPPADAPPAHYRALAAEAIDTGALACARCRVASPLNAITRTSRGPLCDACVRALQTAEAAELAGADAQFREALDGPIEQPSARGFARDLWITLKGAGHVVAKAYDALPGPSWYRWRRPRF